MENERSFQVDTDALQKMEEEKEREVIEKIEQIRTDAGGSGTPEGLLKLLLLEENAFHVITSNPRFLTQFEWKEVKRLLDSSFIMSSLKTRHPDYAETIQSRAQELSEFLS